MCTCVKSTSISWLLPTSILILVFYFLIETGVFHWTYCSSSWPRTPWIHQSPRPQPPQSPSMGSWVAACICLHLALCERCECQLSFPRLHGHHFSDGTTFPVLLPICSITFYSLLWISLKQLSENFSVIGKSRFLTFKLLKLLKSLRWKKFLSPWFSDIYKGELNLFLIS